MKSLLFIVLPLLAAWGVLHSSPPNLADFMLLFLLAFVCVLVILSSML
jgi:hypothetical protein